jgi:Zn-dependent metalloprotease
MRKFIDLKNLRLFFLLSFTTLLTANAQVYEGAEAANKLWGATVVRINAITGHIQYAEFKAPMALQMEAIPTYLKKIYHLQGQYALKLLRADEDELGFTHLRYQQLYNGVPIVGGVLIAHVKDGKLVSFNGEIFFINTNEQKVLEANACLSIALDTVKAEVYKWQVPEEEAMLKEIKENPNATWLPKGELMYCPKDLNFNQPIFYLSYQFQVYANEPLIGENIYISAVDGSIIARENKLHTTNVNGKASTKYSGTQNINTDSTAPGAYRLRETVRGNGVTTLNLKTSTNYGTAVDFTDADNNWNNVNAAKDEVATDCHWGAGKTYDYYKSKFNRNSYDNNNARIVSYVHYASNYDNAFWNGVCMTYGDGNSFKPLTSLDVCGHEITHAVTSNTANLVYSYESGALNESFSDIFGNAVERYAKPSGYSWKIGEEITYSGNGLRNMQNPKLFNHPRCYKSTNWYSGTGDNGGVHINSGVQNWWFYLISEGGSGTNDPGNTYKVDSIGILKAEQIAYRNLTYYLTTSSKYADARFYAIKAATDLYGACSKEVIAVTNAWYACNVGAKYDSGYVKAAFSADTIVCSSSKTVNFYNLSTNAVSAKWYFGDAGTSTSYNTSHTYSSFGSYNIKLVATSCFKNVKDSVTKVAYVKIDSTFNICNAVLMPASGTDSTNKCFSYVYDDGGEGAYKEQRITTYRISAPGADSIRIKFFDFDYELNYDSLYVYKGKYPGGTKLGGFTGSTLPFAGKNFTIAGSMITLRHVSDQMLVGRGFKMYYTAFKKPVAIKAFADTTICYGNSTLLYATGKGGYYTDYFFNWKNQAYNDSIIVNPLALTTYKVYLTDVCTKSKDSAQVSVAVRSPLKVNVSKDTTICVGQTVDLVATATGGKNTSYLYTWNNGLNNNSTQNVSPLNTTTYRVILSDGCTPRLDTAYIVVTVRMPLNAKINTTDTLICYNKTAAMFATGSGGTGNYTYTWNSGLGVGANKSIVLNASQWLTVSLSDGCTVNPALDSVFIKVNPALLVDLNNDSTICKGSSILLSAKSSGGAIKDYQYQWTPVLPAIANNTVSPLTKTKYIVILSDNCSDPSKDSITVDVLQALSIQGLKDSTICRGQSAPLSTIANGGKVSAYAYVWSNGLSNQPAHLVSPEYTTVYQVVLKDACTVLNDTALIKITVKDSLSVQLFTNDTVICYNKLSNLIASANGGNSNYVYTWSNGLGLGSSKSISLANNTWIKVTVTDGCTVLPNADSVYVKVRAPLQIVLNNDSIICKGNSVQLIGMPKGGDSLNYNYVWSPSLANAKINTVSPSLKTKYYLTLKDNCSTNAIDSITIDVLSALKIAGLKDTTICYGGSASFNPNVSGGKPSQYAYQWNNGLGNALPQVVSPKSKTVYKLSLKDNCTKPYDSIQITVDVKAPLKILKTINKSTICYGDSVLLNLNFTGGITSQYNWTINGFNSLKQVNYLKPNNNTRYSIQLNDNCSNIDSTSFDIVVMPLPVVAFSADKTDVCEKETVQFTNTTTGAVSYAWVFSASDKSALTSPSYRYNVAGICDVSLTATGATGCKAILTKPAYINVVKLPVSKFLFNPIDANYLNPDITFVNISTDYISYAWDFGDGSKDNSSSNPLHTYKDTGNYLVVLTTFNSLGCTNVVQQMVRIKDVYSMYIPTAISLNGDGLNDELKIVARGIKTYSYSLFNRWGAKVFETNELGASFKGFDNEGKKLMNGTYILMMTVKDFSGKVYYIKQTLEIL